MFPLFKERKFNDYLNDTFGFFRVCGKHYFRLYFTINGSLLLLGTVLVYLLTKVYFEFLGTAMSGISEETADPATAINSNSGFLVGLGLTVALLFLMITLLQYAFPVVYLDLYDARKGAPFSAKDILLGIRKRIGKILKFIIGFVFVIFPVLFIVMGLNVLLMFILIGFPLLLIVFPVMMSWVTLTYFYYMNSEESFMSALGDAFETIKGQFWPIVLSTLIMFIIYYVVSSIFTLVPYLIGMASMFTSLQSGDASNAFSTMSVMMSIVMALSIVVSFVLNNLLLINQGLIYYSHIENAESSVSNSAIDLIGTESE